MHYQSWVIHLQCPVKLSENNIQYFVLQAKPAKNLWVGGISLSVSKEQLEEEFSKIGKLENFKFLRDRNSALVEYYRLEDAATAVKTLNGRRIGGEPIRVDFLRSQPFRRVCAAFSALIYLCVWCESPPHLQPHLQTTKKKFTFIVLFCVSSVIVAHVNLELEPDILLLSHLWILEGPWPLDFSWHRSRPLVFRIYWIWPKFLLVLEI